MRTGFALMLLFGGGLLAYSAFQTPPDPRLVLTGVLSGTGLGGGKGMSGKVEAVGDRIEFDVPPRGRRPGGPR